MADEAGIIRRRRSSGRTARLRIAAVAMGCLSLFFAIAALLIDDNSGARGFSPRTMIDICFLGAPFAAAIAYWILGVRRRWAQYLAVLLIMLPIPAGLMGFLLYNMVS